MVADLKFLTHTLFSNSLPIQTIPSSLFMDIFERKGNQVVKKSNLKEASALLLFPAVALTAMDTAPPPNREITTCVLARTTPFLLTVRIPHPHGFCNPGGPSVCPEEVINTIQSACKSLLH